MARPGLAADGRSTVTEAAVVVPEPFLALVFVSFIANQSPLYMYLRPANPSP